MRFRLRKGHKRLPFGGHHYTANGITAKGDTAEEVVEKIKNYRLINGIPLGDPMSELLEYYADKFPWMIENNLDDQGEKPENANYVRWRGWLISQWGKPFPKTIGEVQAVDRWAICEKCEFCRPRTWENTPEAIEFERKSLLLKNARNSPKNVKFCTLHGWDIGVSSYVENPAPLSDKKDKQDYEGCWV